jgi:heme a synthase
VARSGRAIAALALLQVGLGFLNVVLLAPVWLQMIHLLVADLIWIGFVVLGVNALYATKATAAARADAAPLLASVDTVIR